MQISAEKIWTSAQDHLRAKLGRDTFNMWFAPLRASAVDTQNLTIEAPNEFCEVWLKDNYLGLMQDAVAVAAGCKLEVKFKAINASPLTVHQLPAAKAAAKAKPVEAPQERAERTPINGDLHFNPKNTFDTFVVGNNNNFAYAASKAVAETPGKAYKMHRHEGGVGKYERQVEVCLAEALVHLSAAK